MNEVAVEHAQEDTKTASEGPAEMTRGFHYYIAADAQRSLQEEVAKYRKAVDGQRLTRATESTHRAEASRIKEQLSAELEKSDGIVTPAIKAMTRKISDHERSAAEDDAIAVAQEPVIAKLNIVASYRARQIDGWRNKYSRMFAAQELDAATAAFAKRIHALIKFEAQRRILDEPPELRMMYGDKAEAWVFGDVMNMVKAALERPDLEPDPLPQDDVRMLELFDIGDFRPLSPIQSKQLEAKFNL